MTDTNYTPDEVRLLDEFARTHMGAICSIESYDAPAEHVARKGFELAAAMIAERRKRVQPQQPLTAERYLAALKQQPTPPAEQPADGGRLTEDEVRAWEKDLAMLGDDRSQMLDCDEMRGVIAMLREGLAAKIERNNYKALVDGAREQLGVQLGQRLEHAIQEAIDGKAEAEQERDEARENAAWMQDRINEFHARAEKAEVSLAEARPVLDAVAGSNLFNPPSVWDSTENKLMQAYAARRRAQQAKQGGGAS